MRIILAAAVQSACFTKVGGATNCSLQSYLSFIVKNQIVMHFWEPFKKLPKFVTSSVFAYQSVLSMGILLKVFCEKSKILAIFFMSFP